MAIRDPVKKLWLSCWLYMARPDRKVVVDVIGVRLKRKPNYPKRRVALQAVIQTVVIQTVMQAVALVASLRARRRNPTRRVVALLPSRPAPVLDGMEGGLRGNRLGSLRGSLRG
jgi:hypothetical protein